MGTFWNKNLNLSEQYVIKIISYKKPLYAGGDYKLKIKTTPVSKSGFSCVTGFEEIYADVLLSSKQYVYTPYNPDKLSAKCKICSGSGTVTEKFKHTNDTEYTTGTKTTYTKTTVSKCNSCKGSGKEYIETHEIKCLNSN